MHKQHEDASVSVKIGRLRQNKQAALHFLGNPDLATELGRMHLEGKLLETQVLAGKEWGELVRKHRDIVTGAPPSHPKVGELERRSRSASAREHDDKAIARVTARYDRVFAGVIDSGRDGVAYMKALNKLCVDDQLLDYGETQLVKKALDRVAVLLGLTGVTQMRRG